MNSCQNHAPLTLLSAGCGVLFFVLVIGATVAACEGTPASQDAGGPDATCASSAACNDDVYCNGIEVCSAGACVPGALPCMAGLRCDEAADRCVADCATAPDRDRDGADSLACGGTDCDDDDAAVAPGAIEICDGADVDEDCDPTTFGTRDVDDDGYIDAACCNGTRCGDDCDDALASTSPEGAEVCNSRDDDCDSATDEMVLVSVYRDADADGFGDAAMVMELCAAGAGYAAMPGDCDDAAPSVHPGAYDRCLPAGVDDDCNTTPDDPPSGCECSVPSRPCPLLGACAASTQVCVGGRWADCSVVPSVEVCGNSIDEDCDGEVDDGCACSGTVRACGISVGACESGLEACLGDGSWGPCTGAVGPVAETCDGRDEDCDSSVDEGVGLRCWTDADGDGYAVLGALSVVRCGAGAACNATETSRDPAVGADCSDADARAFPGQTMAFSDRAVLGIGGYDYDCNGGEERVGLALPIGSCPAVEPCGSSLHYAGAPPCGGWGAVRFCVATGDSGRTCMTIEPCTTGPDCPSGASPQLCR